MANQIEWRDPPRGEKAHTRWSEIVAQLRERPGEWAMVAVRRQRSQVTRLRAMFPDIEWTTHGADAGIEFYGRARQDSATPRSEPGEGAV